MANPSLTRPGSGCIGCEIRIRQWDRFNISDVDSILKAPDLFIDKDAEFSKLECPIKK